MRRCARSFADDCRPLVVRLPLVRICSFLFLGARAVRARNARASSCIQLES
ncbi:hypothetical protein BURPS1106B_2110 [Burkholderia pseudomallei 1106b]|uniref:Uncharacterized protein n=1 Tax=Burkholderia pseudomallei (strain 1106a) TaxID=357348 RepID=A3P9T0_BURP0|nr:hypothetical protein BMASAVP1_1031 [Burkholderia mallei SAVP1]ABN94222.1 hypothetical protein BURPS1106A_A3061 [Burkholderia pseudomallei 1106a]EBA46925.1 hypothetical protein BURPS305_2512 [Burkholderia pseudomallei 305]EEP51614.1 conserved hypothetical protein [Burkholderia pseudomallei MSHR346]EES21992.1 hypothetical protein BURPS1106B_2110 [Burkholderia pseudomallei 1106b]